MAVSLHDTLFKETQKRKANVVDLLQASLSSNLFNSLDTDTLNIDETEYTDEELRKYFSDMVYNCNIDNNNNKIKISLLFEHKSFIDENIYFQVLNYITKIWNLTIKQEKKPTPIVPILFYHGDKEWEIGNLYDKFSGINDEMKRYIPNFEIVFINLQQYTDEEIIKLFKNVANQIIFLIMKNIKDVNKIKQNIKEYLELGKEYYNEDEGRYFLISIIKYLFNILNLNKQERDEIINKIDKIISK